MHVAMSKRPLQCRIANRAIEARSQLDTQEACILDTAARHRVVHRQKKGARRVTPQGDSTATPARSPNRLRRVPTSEQVSEHVRRLIFDGELRPGDRIPQDAIAAELGVSRIPVREALIEMARDGLIINEPHIGAFVGPFDEEVVRDHFDIVAMLQGMAAERLAACPDPSVMASLRAIAERMPALTDDAEVHETAIEFQRIVNFGGGSSRQRTVLRALGRMFPTGFFTEIKGSVDAQKAAVALTFAAIERGLGTHIRDEFIAANRRRADLVVGELRARGSLLP
jgi:DNA-binding FadR family transcriptional regulator